jgi:hypothetical protein
MKTPLRCLLFLILAGLSFNKLSAQCTVSDILIQNIIPAASQPHRQPLV